MVMRMRCLLLVIAAALTSSAGLALAQDAPPVPEAARDAVTNYITTMEIEEGGVSLIDEQTGETRHLAFEELLGPSGAAGLPSVCVRMSDEATGERVDVDFELEPTADGLEVAELYIHQVGGRPRYTYDAEGRRVPSAEAPQPATP